MLYAVCLAQSWTQYVDMKIDGAKFNQANADLSQIEIDFCDKWGEKSIVYSLSAEEKKDICLKASNASPKDIEVTIWFVDGVVTNDQRQNKACMQAGEDKRFWQYVTGYKQSFIVPANNLIFQHATLQLPKWTTWFVPWCLVYYTKSIKMTEWDSFSILMRKAKFIDVNVKKLIVNRNYLYGILFLAVCIWGGYLILRKNKL